MFSAELPWYCFCAEIKVLGMERNFARNFYIINKNFWSQDPSRGRHLGEHNRPGRAPLSWCAQVGCAHLVAPQTLIPTLQNPIFGEKIREKELSCFTRRGRRLLFFIRRPDLEPVWGFGERDLRSLSSPTLLDRQFHDALPIGSE